MEFIESLPYGLYITWHTCDLSFLCLSKIYGNLMYTRESHKFRTILTFRAWTIFWSPLLCASGNIFPSSSVIGGVSAHVNLICESSFISLFILQCLQLHKGVETKQRIIRRVAHFQRIDGPCFHILLVPENLCIHLSIGKIQLNIHTCSLGYMLR